MIVELASRVVDRVGLIVAARLALRVVALETETVALRCTLAETRSDLNDLRAVVHEVYIGPIAGGTE